MWFLLALVLASVAGWLLSWRISRKISEQKHHADIASLRSRLRYQQATLNAYTIVENFTCGWLNLLIKAMWPGFLLNIINKIATSLLSNLFRNLSRNFANNSVTKLFNGLDLVEFSLGCLPPSFANATARVLPQETALELEFDISYESCGAHLVVDTELNISGQTWPIQLVLGKFVLHGRLFLQLQLSRSAVLGLPGLQFCFVTKPRIDFEILSKGIMLTQVPGVLSKLRAALLHVIMNEAVDPARVWVNLQNPFLNLFLKKQNGRKGQLQVTIVEATDIKPLSTKDVPQREVELCMSFVELHVHGKIYTTPIAPQGNHPSWCWDIHMPVDRVPTSDPDCNLRFAVCNFISDAQPQMIGSAELKMSSLTLEDVIRAEPHTMKVKLKPPKGSKGGGGWLHVALSYKQHSGGSADEPRRETSGRMASMSSLVKHSKLDQVPEDSKSALEPAAGTHEGVPGKMSFAVRPSSDIQTGFETDSVGGRSGFSQENDWLSVAAMTRVEKQLKQEAETNGAAVAEWRKKVLHLERGLQYEMERRYHQELRALVEGAEFNMYRGKDMSTRLVWYNPATNSTSATIRFEGGNALPRVARAQKSKAKRKEHYHELDAGSIVNVTYGYGHFRDDVEAHMEKKGLFKLFGKGKFEHDKSDRCFSVLFRDQRSRFPALHLEVPEDGNNRSRNEWVSAFGSLMLGYI